MLNVGFGSSGTTGRFNFAKGQIDGGIPQATQTTVGAYKNTDGYRLANVFVKSLNVIDLNSNAFAYHFVEKAPGVVIKNLFVLFDSVLDVLAQRLDDEAVKDNAEYECAIIAKRIQDALGVYKNPTN